MPAITASAGRGSPRLASSSAVAFSSRENSRNCSRQDEPPPVADRPDKETPAEAIW
jgi:hypothetical protein